MLEHIQIRDFTLIDNLDQSLARGMTVMTGETGAGKSIIVDAINLILGSRATPKLVRSGAKRCEISGVFDLTLVPQAQAWLKEHELDEGIECVIRRTLTDEGRSRAFINGRTVTLAELKALSNLLINIHGQHENQSLMNQDIQLQMLDAFAAHESLLTAVKHAYGKWRALQDEIKQLSAQGDVSARVELLQYQLSELDNAALKAGEVEQLTATHKKLANADTFTHELQSALALLNDEHAHSVVDSLARIKTLCEQQQAHLPALSEIIITIEAALINCQESASDLEQLLQANQGDPQQLQQIEERLSQLHQLARKHHVEPEQLLDVFERCQQEYDALVDKDARLAELERSVAKVLDAYLNAAEKLNRSRQKAAKKLAKLVMEKLTQLNMPHCVFQIDFDSLPTPTAQGSEKCCFTVSPNPGLPQGPLNKIASGGELSRISLAIQVIIAECYNTPVLIFDEVDVGIGGATAEVVGQLLRALGERAQVLCITHLAQVAANAHHHVRVEKHQDKKRTTSELTLLEGKARVEEIARMLGGVTVTDKTRETASEMLVSG